MVQLALVNGSRNKTDANSESMSLLMQRISYENGTTLDAARCAYSRRKLRGSTVRGRTPALRANRGTLIMLRFIAKHPWLTVLLVLCGSCMAFGPAATGSWLHVHGIQAIGGTWRFVVALVRS